MLSAPLALYTHLAYGCIALGADNADRSAGDGEIAMTELPPDSGPTQGMARQAVPSDQQRQLQALLRAPVPKIHANGFGFAANATDVTVLLFDAEQIVGSVTFAYPTAKTLVGELDEAIKNYETKTGEKVRDLKYLMGKMSAPEK